MADQSEDLAVIAHPATDNLEMSTTNSTGPSRMQTQRSSTTQQKIMVPPKQERPRVEPGEEVLAVIRGTVQGLAESRRAPGLYREACRGQLPGHRAIHQTEGHPRNETAGRDGDHQEIRNNKKGFFFWTGGVYAWHPKRG